MFQIVSIVLIVIVLDFQIEKSVGGKLEEIEATKIKSSTMEPVFPARVSPC